MRVLPSLYLQSWQRNCFGPRLCTVRLETPRGSEELEIMGRKSKRSFTMVLQSPRWQSMEMADDSIDDSRLTLIMACELQVESSIGSGVPQLREEDRGERSPSSTSAYRMPPYLWYVLLNAERTATHSDGDQDEAGSPKSTR
jgi:hypothetical protein